MAYVVAKGGYDAAAWNFNAALTDVPQMFGVAGTSGTHLTVRPHHVATGPLVVAVQGAHLTVDSQWVIRGAVGEGMTAYGAAMGFDESGMIVGGLVQSLVLYGGVTGDWGLQISGVAVQGADLSAAVLSGDTADDQALLAGMFDSDDWAELSEAADVIDTGAARDLVIGNGGGDTLAGGDGNDLIDGEKGWDRIDGGNGNDLIFGGAGDDRATGGWGRDTIMGGADHDVMTGGRQADCFVFAAADPSETATITDFDIGTDKIWILGPDGTDLSFLSLIIAQNKGGTSVSVSDPARGVVHVIFLKGIVAADLSADDFNMAPATDLAAAAADFYHHWDYFAGD